MSRRRLLKSAVTTLKRFLGLTRTEADSYDRSLQAIGYMRREGWSLSRAANESETTPATVRKYAGTALERQRSGRFRVKNSDRLLRRMRIISTEGVVEAVVRSSKQASLDGEHANAVKHYARTGDVRVLKPFRGKQVAGYELETDPDALDDLGIRHELDWLDLYLTSS